MKDISGISFGNWMPLKREKRGRISFWLCRCKCGIQKWVRLNHLTSGESKSCGCLASTDLTGKKFGSLTAIKKVDKNIFISKRSDFKGQPLHGSVWLCKCDCGLETVVRRSALVQGQACGKCYRAKTPQARVNFLYSLVKARSKRDGLDFSLSKENVEFLCFSKCYYCGNEPSQRMKLYNWSARNKEDDPDWNVVYNGIDRKDNSQGYVIENCVSCCKVCNTMKSTLTMDQFIDHIKRIIKNVR